MFNYSITLREFVGNELREAECVTKAELTMNFPQNIPVSRLKKPARFAVKLHSQSKKKTIVILNSVQCIKNNFSLPLI